ncbi:glycosyltransferase [Brevibacterium aurantiacum]|uniref:Glycosyl transferase family 1 domain-containing protein n=2 Tax=Brevibacterium aurantiacum TaxID=273384 RepID=A0A2A3ZAM1_BREAU|nr:glycosyltransferase [Brevibacterium aurantiacum]PCC48680.1 hypothetical protein CIK62_17480 [Brevibacterium aurantiacum]
MNMVPKAKRALLNNLPPAMWAYLRKERHVWEGQFQKNKNSLSGAVRSRSFTKALFAPIKKNTVVWESFAGNGALCNPEAIFRRMVDAPEYNTYRHVWVLSSKANDSRFKEEFQDHPRVSFVKHKSREYFEVLETSEFLVNNATFPTEYIKRPEQTYVNVWHGTPLKKMGYDIEGGAAGARNVLRNFMSADYLVSQNSFMTERMYLDGYKLRNIYEGAIIEEGYPRSDSMFGTDAGASARRILREKGIETQGKKVLLYAPTWRGDSFYKPDADAGRLKATLRKLQDSAALQGWVVLLKAHQVIVDQLVDDPEIAEFLVPNDVPANEALAITDLLVSDYSSIFVDYLATGRPIAFHIPDVDSYAESRGLYMGVPELPGPVSSTVDELLDHLESIIGGGGLENGFAAESERYAKLSAEMTPRDDGGASARIIDIVFGRNEAEYNVRRNFSDGRLKLMVYLGGMLTNGITSSALNLLNELDPEVYDVTAFYRHSNQLERQQNAALIPRHVRHVIRDTGTLQFPLLGSMQKFEQAAVDNLDSDARDERLWEMEWRRVFGHAEFDAAVDFSGYAAYWSRIITNGRAGRRVIWQHNDLEADAEREVNGKKPHYRNLRGVFKLYQDFDALVSVSPDLRDINKTNLAAFAPAEKFVSARNTINVERVRTGGGRSKAQNPDAGVHDLSNLADTVYKLGQFYSYEELIAEASRQQLVTQFIGERGGRSFVTVGRLSPEKNHARLIRAFAEVLQDEPEAKLVIIGDGPLAPELKQLAVSLGISGSVQFTGRMQNPYAVMSACDCFVMSSDYEGQPIVILEARVLGLPVLVTRFGSAESAMEGSGGLIVECDEKALAAGMNAFLAGEVGAEPFDGDAYNREVVKEFTEVVFG